MREPLRHTIYALEDRAAVVPHCHIKYILLRPRESLRPFKVYASSADKDLSLQAPCHVVSRSRKAYIINLNADMYYLGISYEAE